MEEISTGKMIRKFAVKLILWFILIDLVIGCIVLVTKVSGFENLDDDDVEEAGKAINSLMTSLIVVDIAAIVCPPLLATRKIKKKYKITEENKNSFFKGVAISMIVVAAIMGVSHIAIKSVITKAVSEQVDGMEWKDIKKALKDVDEFIEEYEDEIPGSLDEFKEVIDMVEGMYSKLNIIAYDFVLYIAMIGVEYYLIVKKEQEA